MADIARLAASTRALKARSDESVGWPLAAIKAIEASGVRHKPDVNRLKKQVLLVLSNCGDYKPRSRVRLKFGKGRP